jgi:hypothetical protein
MTNGLIFSLPLQLVHNKIVNLSLDHFPPLHSSLFKTNDLSGNALKKRLVSSALKMFEGPYPSIIDGRRFFHSLVVREFTLADSPQIAR